MALAAEIQNCHLKFKMKICKAFLESIPFLYTILSQVTLSIYYNIVVSKHYFAMKEKTVIRDHNVVLEDYTFSLYTVYNKVHSVLQVTCNDLVVETLM